MHRTYKPSIAFVLSGAVSLGAIQVGMLRALYEREIMLATLGSFRGRCGAGQSGRFHEIPWSCSTAQPTCSASPIVVAQFSSGRQIRPQPRGSRAVQCSTAMG